MWVVDEAAHQGQPIEVVIDAVMASKFAAIYTSSNVRRAGTAGAWSTGMGQMLTTHAPQSITQALYYLASSPKYAAILREEVEIIVREHGWNKIAIGTMWKLDSFMRESQRLNGIMHSEYDPPPLNGFTTHVQFPSCTTQRRNSRSPMGRSFPQAFT